VGYRSAYLGFDARAMRHAIGDGPVLLNGGGNFGDLYAGQQQLRERVLAECRAHAVVQLPQSIHFEDGANLARVRRLVGDHGRVTILCREARSEALARSAFDADVRACPDMALAMPVERVDRPRRTRGIVWITRGDRESSWEPPHQDGIRVVDWAVPADGQGPWPPGRERTWRAVQRGLERMAQDDRFATAMWRPISEAFEVLAEAWVAPALALIADAGVVVTERLHGHLLCVLAGVPHVVLDGGYGKIAAVLDGPTRTGPLVHRASSVEEALRLAADLQDGVPR
jgi:exopolysaccharide biosynthesis predicted pyruvyltransferase EpsI